MFRTLFVSSVVNRCACVAVRNYRRAGNKKTRELAGIRIQNKIFDDIETLEEDPERTYDADFSRLDVSHREHERELAEQKEQAKYHMIKRKYFKDPKLPNFLTWAEKEQIRKLHKRDPSEWTPERLAESFPAVEEVIVKILKAKWTPTSMQRVQKHDENVQKNWKLFKADKIRDLTPDVREHLKKFSNRNFDSVQNAYAQLQDDPFKFKFPEPKKKEFLSIITSCKRNDEKKTRLIDQNDAKQIEASQESSVSVERENQIQFQAGIQISNKQRRKSVTFDQLAKNKAFANDVDTEEMHLKVVLPEHEKTLAPIDSKPTKSIRMQHTTNDDYELLAEENSQDIKTCDLALAEVGTSSKIFQKYADKVGYLDSVNVPQIRYSINIPPKHRKKGSIYKLEDCFYDDRGKFMYRVPGLVD